MTQWMIEPAHSSANFSVRHMMFSTVHGVFEDFSGTINFDPQHRAASSVEATIEAASVNTNASDRDNHLRSADFFDVAQHPQLTFKSTAVDVIDDNHANLRGDLTIRGTTRPVTLAVELLGMANDPWGMQRAGFVATATINREDFGLTWNQALETGGVLVGKDIEIRLDIQAVPVEAMVPA